MKASKIIIAIVAATALGLGAAQATQITGTIGFTSAPNPPGSIHANGGGSFTLNFNNPLHVNFGTDDYSGGTDPDRCKLCPDHVYERRWTNVVKFARVDFHGRDDDLLL